MYNAVTTNKIKDIPSIGDIDVERLPEELTRIYAQIISLRSKVADGTINFQDKNLLDSISLLRRLSSSLENILLVEPNHLQKQSIAFVAATAHALIFRMGLLTEGAATILEIDYVSSRIAAVILFLIGNSQADAAETSMLLLNPENNSIIERQLIESLAILATGKLANINLDYFNEELIDTNNIESAALDYLWRELGLGIIEIIKKLTGLTQTLEIDHFDRVVELATSENDLFNHSNVFTGPQRLAILFKILKDDILSRGIINIEAPQEVDPDSWQTLLSAIAKNRPYLWENHQEVVETEFLNIGISAILTLPTGAGKSTLSELKIASTLYSGKNIIYIVPTHALEDQVNRDLKEIFDEFDSNPIKIDGEFTDFGDTNESPILVITPERCLTLININPNFLSSIGLVVFDEFHLIHGKNIKKDRRAIDAMYCLLSLFDLIPSADYLLISAMVENGEEIKSWVEKITQRRCVLFSSTWKPTRQLHGCLAFKNDDINELSVLIREAHSNAKTKNPPAALKKGLNIEAKCLFSLKNIWETAQTNDYYISKLLDSHVRLGINKNWRLTPNRYEVAAAIGSHFASLGLKTLIFVDSPRITGSTAKKIEQNFDSNVNNFEKFINDNKHLVNSLTLELGSFEHSYFDKGSNVGVHHGGLLSIERELIEKYFKWSNGATVLVATATLAQGINLPAEIVIIAGDDRFDIDEGSRERFKPYELLNAAGRAGRAGQSSQGAVILIPGEIVTIDNLNISNRWWELRNEVFSKGDQCLKIEDPFEYFLDSLTENVDQLSADQINVLYRFKSEKISSTETGKLLRKSLFAHQSVIHGTVDNFESQLEKLINARNGIDNQAGGELWHVELSFKTGLESSIILELSEAIESIGFERFLTKNISEIIEWYFNWIKSNDNNFERMIVKSRTRNQIKKTIGLKSEQDYEISEILQKLNILSNVLQHYVSGKPLNEINNLISGLTGSGASQHLNEARSFVLRLIPELSFSFGVLSLIIIEIAKSKGKIIDDLPIDIRVLASCIREGVDSSEKLFYKKNNNIQLRVETHKRYKKQ